MRVTVIAFKIRKYYLHFKTQNVPHTLRNQNVNHAPSQVEAGENTLFKKTEVLAKENSYRQICLKVLTVMKIIVLQDHA